ncbi:unnamed protein product [Ascophyllum nodosum]
MKTVPLGHGKDSKAMAQLRSEVALIRGLDHPNIVRLQQVFETEDSLFLVMDLCTGGDMMTRWERNPKLRYSEAEAALTVKKIMNAVRHCHDRRVVHRDIKLENLLWEHPGDDAEPQLADFGLSVTFSDDSDVFREDVGSIFNLAPEVLAKNYTKACDCWSVGVIAYMMLSGMPPFRAPTDDGVKLKIRWTKASSSCHKLWENVSEDAKDFIKRLLVKDPNKRMTAEEACAHPWVASQRPRDDGVPRSQQIDRALTADASAGSAATDSAKALDPKVIRRLQKYKEYGKLKRVALGVIARSLSPEGIKKLKREFNKVDVEGRGEIRPLHLRKSLHASGDFTDEEVARIFEHMDVDHDGVIGLNEFLAASLDNAQVNNEQNLRLAFERLDDGHSGKVTMDGLKRFTGATVDDQTLEDQITETDFREAMLGSKEAGLSYEVFQKAMVKTFSTDNLDKSMKLRNVVLVASEMNTAELASKTERSQKDADAIIKTAKIIVANNPDALLEDDSKTEAGHRRDLDQSTANGSHPTKNEDGTVKHHSGPSGKHDHDRKGADVAQSEAAVSF